jgi:SAM-dependent methyltransferase
MITRLKTIKHYLAEKYMFLRTATNVFRLHELSFLRRHLSVRDTDIALDIACGIGLYTSRIFKRAKLAIGMDLLRDNTVIAHHFRHSNTYFYQGNAERLAHPDNTFDVVVAMCALEHFSDIERAAKEMFRALKLGGQLIITVDSLETIDSPEFIKFHRKYCGVNRYFTRDSIRRVLEQDGFRVDHVQALLKSRFSATTCVFGFKIMRHGLAFNLFSCLVYPITVIADIVCRSDRGIILGICARKPSTLP